VRLKEVSEEKPMPSTYHPIGHVVGDYEVFRGLKYEIEIPQRAATGQQTKVISPGNHVAG
jgi:hypothetical protein